MLIGLFISLSGQTIPIKNFLQHLSLAPTCSSFLYTTCKTPIPFSSYITGTLLNCTFCFPKPSSNITLNCRTLQTTHDDMPSNHLKYLRHLRHWMHSGMPSDAYVLLRHPRHPSHPSHLSYLGTIDNPNTLNPYPLYTTPTDSYHRAFITEMPPNDPGPSEGYFTDNSLNPLPTATPLLPHYTSQSPYISQIALDGHSSDIPLDALDGHSSLLEIHWQIYNSFALDPYNSLVP